MWDDETFVLVYDVLVLYVGTLGVLLLVNHLVLIHSLLKYLLVLICLTEWLWQLID